MVDQKATIVLTPQEGEIFQRRDRANNLLIFYEKNSGILRQEKANFKMAQALIRDTNEDISKITVQVSIFNLEYSDIGRLRKFIQNRIENVEAQQKSQKEKYNKALESYHKIDKEFHEILKKRNPDGKLQMEQKKKN